jgi:hypothetical protein
MSAAAEKTRLLRAFHNKLADQPLEPGNPFYVDYLEGRAGDPIAHLKTQIDWSEAGGMYLLSGHPGSGKSTELRRLRAKLEELGCVVFIADMARYVNMTSPIEITDFLVSLVAALSEEVKARYQDDPLAEDYWTRFKNFLQTRITVDQMEVGAGPLTITTSLKEDVTFRQLVQDALRGHVAALVREAHGFTADVVTSIRDKEGNADLKVVFLVDSLEKIRGVGAGAEAVHSSVRNLFATHASSLKLPLLHVLYTLPRYVTTLAPNLGSQIGCGVQAIPSIHVFSSHSHEPDPDGLAVMREIVSRRWADWQQVFSPAEVDRMALSSGGDLRDFLYLMRYSLIEAASSSVPLPVPTSVIEAAENNVRANMLPIANEDREWLRRISETKLPELQTNEALPALARFFDSKLVLNYRNGEDWYDVHPLLRDIINDDSGA